MAGQTPLVRQWILLRTRCARRQGVAVKELAAEMEVNEKTIRRDLETFQSAGFPIDEQAGAFGRKSYLIDPRWSKPDIVFTFDEALALYLGRKFLRPLGHHLLVYFGSNVRSVCQSWFEYNTTIARQFAEQSLTARCWGFFWRSAGCMTWAESWRPFRSSARICQRNDKGRKKKNCKLPQNDDQGSRVVELRECTGRSIPCK
ncbi:helix-turn-helix transcriptional regulator [Planctomycetota bacterium]